MTTRRDDSDARRRAVAITVWQDEGARPSPAVVDEYYGRRVEADRSWTVYQVFTGVPARVGGRRMTALSRSEATDNMLALNARLTPGCRETVGGIADGR